jgi:hypothetical protein
VAGRGALQDCDVSRLHAAINVPAGSNTKAERGVGGLGVGGYRCYVVFIPSCRIKLHGVIMYIIYTLTCHVTTERGLVSMQLLMAVCLLMLTTTHGQSLTCTRTLHAISASSGLAAGVDSCV